VNAAPAIEEGRTALEGAAEHGRIDLLQLLINAGADTNSSQCTRALKLAATYGHDAVCRLLNRSRKRDFEYILKSSQVETDERARRSFHDSDEEHYCDYQTSGASLLDDDAEKEGDSFVENGNGQAGIM
jgi:ankyrin repeat protein